MKNRQDTGLRVGTGLRVDPQVVLTSRLIELNQAELEATISAELEANPALERLDDSEEPLTDEAILRHLAPQELGPRSEDFEFLRSLPQGFDDDIDWLDFARSEPSLREHLRAQLLPELPPNLQNAGKFAIENIDNRGYLIASDEEIALDTNCTLEQASSVVRLLQQCEPAGVGARSLQECLLLQLRSPLSLEEKLARLIVKELFAEFLANNIKPISRRFRAMPSVVEKAFAHIRSLNPYPGETVMYSWGIENCASSAATADIVLHRTEQGWSVLVPGADERCLCVSHSYRARLKELRELPRASKEERRHIVDHIEKATRFISAVARRRENLRKIGEYLIAKQAGFCSTGEYQFLKPLTRVEIASAIGVHDSTVSRATQDKFVQIATGQVVPFEVFFKPALRIQKLIEQIVANEDPDAPLSDERISQMLSEVGVTVARRTVNKYRDRNRQLSSRKRKLA